MRTVLALLQRFGLQLIQADAPVPSHSIAPWLRLA